MCLTALQSSAQAQCLASCPRTSIITHTLIGETFGGRPQAMGQAYVALADDIYGLAFNPAGLGRLGDVQAAAQYSSELFDQRIAFFGLGVPLSRSHTLGLSYALLNTDNLYIFDNSGTHALGPPGQKDQLVHLGYSYSLRNLPFSSKDELHLGTAIKYLDSSLGPSLNTKTLAMDLGLLYVKSFSSARATLGASASNLGSGLRYYSSDGLGFQILNHVDLLTGNNANPPLPRIYRFGGSYQETLWHSDRLTASLELDRLAAQHATVEAFGLEYLVRDLLALRLGYRINGNQLPIHFDSGFFAFPYLGSGTSPPWNERPWSLGAGLNLKNLSLDYAVSFLENYGSIHRVSLAYSFDVSWVEPRTSLSADTLFGQTQKFVSQGRYFDAMDYTRKLMELLPEDSSARSQQSSIRAWVTTTINAGTSNKKFYYASGHQAFYQEQWERAEQWLAEAATLEPSNAEIRRYLEIVRKRLQEKRDLEHLKAAARVSYLFELAARAHAAEDDEKARKVLAEILRISSYEPAMKLLAEINAAQKKLPEKTSPEHSRGSEQAMALFYQAVRQYSEGDLMEALQVLKAAQRLDPENDYIQTTLHHVERELKDIQEQKRREKP